MMTYEQEREISSFVSREVIYCVSALVSTLAQTAAESGKLADGTYYEDIMEICVQDDYEEAARDHIRLSMDRGGCQEYLEQMGDDVDFSGMSDDDIEHRLIDALEEEKQWQEFCESNDIDPYTVEAYEHWIVSNWLAGKLEEKGEMIGRDICGLTIWGRTTTGQSIVLDSVIQEIYKELQGN